MHNVLFYSMQRIMFVFAPQLIKFFINDPTTIEYGSYFQRIMCFAVVLYPMVFVIMAVFQAAGQSLKPFILSFVHKGSIDILLFFIIRQAFGLKYILWASPIMAGVALIVAIILVRRFFRSMKLT